MSVSNIFVFLFFLILAFYLRVVGISIGGDLLINVLMFTSLASSVLQVLLVFLIGRMFNLLAGLIASGFLAVSFLSVIYSQSFEPYNLVTFFVLLLSFFSLKAYKKNNLKLVRQWISIGFFVIFVFYVFFAFPLLVQNYYSDYLHNRSNSFFLHLFRFLLTGIGPVVWVSSFFLFRHVKDFDLQGLKILYSLPLFYLGILGFLHLRDLGLSVLFVPYISLASAFVFSRLCETWTCNNKRFFLILLFLFALYIPLKYSLHYNKLLSLSDTRQIATSWIKKNTTRYFKITCDKNSIQTPKSAKRFELTSKLLKQKDWFKILRKKTDYVVVNSIDIDEAFNKRPDTLKKKYYRKILKLKPYMVINPYYKDIEENMKHLIPEDLYLPYETLWLRERPGPIIKIYKL